MPYIRSTGIIEVENQGGGDCLFYSYSTFLIAQAQIALSHPEEKRTAADKHILKLFKEQYPDVTHDQIIAFQLDSKPAGGIGPDLGQRNPADDKLLKDMATAIRTRLIAIKRESICDILVGDKKLRDSGSYWNAQVLPVKMKHDNPLSEAETSTDGLSTPAFLKRANAILKSGNLGLSKEEKEAAKNQAIKDLNISDEKKPYAEHVYQRALDGFAPKPEMQALYGLAGQENVEELNRINQVMGDLGRAHDLAPEKAFFLNLAGLTESDMAWMVYAKQVYQLHIEDNEGDIESLLAPPDETGLIISGIRVAIAELASVDQLNNRASSSAEIVAKVLEVIGKPNALKESALDALITTKESMAGEETWGSETDVQMIAAQDGFRVETTQMVSSAVREQAAEQKSFLIANRHRVDFLDQKLAGNHWRASFDIFAQSRYPKDSPHVAKLVSKYAKYVPMKAVDINKLGFTEIDTVLSSYRGVSADKKLGDLQIAQHFAARHSISDLRFADKIAALRQKHKDVDAFMAELKKELVAQVQSGELDLTKPSELRDRLDYLLMRSEGRTAKDAYTHHIELIAQASKEQKSKAVEAVVPIVPEKLTFADINASLIAYRHAERQAAKKTPLSWIRSSHPFDEELVSILLQISNDCQQKGGSAPSVDDFMFQLKNVLVAQLKTGKINLEKDPVFRDCIDTLFGKHRGKKFTELYDNQGNSKEQKAESAQAAAAVKPGVDETGEIKNSGGPAVL